MSPADNALNQFSSVVARWHASTHTTFYTLQCSPAPDFSSGLITITGSDTFTLLTSLTPGTTYYWRVNAVNSTGTSSWPMACAFTVTTITTPLAPQNFSATAGNGSVLLRWSSNSANNFLMYRIYGGTSQEPTTLIDSVMSVTDTVRSILGLTNGTEYYYRLTALNTLRVEGSYSAEVNVTPVLSVICQPASRNISLGRVAVAAFKDSVLLIVNAGTDSLIISSATCPKSTFSGRLSRLRVAPGATFFDTLRFVPAAIGDDSSVIVIVSNAATSPDTIKVNGTGTGAQLVCALKSFSLGTVLVGSVKDSAITIQNTGNDTLRISASVSSDTVFSLIPAVFSIAPGQSVVNTLRYKPLSVKKDSAAIIIASNKPFDTLTIIGSGQVTTGIIRAPVLPKMYSFSMTKNIGSSNKILFRYALPKASLVRLELYTLKGRKIGVLADKVQMPNYYALPFSIPNSGVYVCVFKASSVEDKSLGMTRKMTITFMK
jgi:hypothetical protein